MGPLSSAIGVVALIVLAALAGASEPGRVVLGLVIPYAALATFLAGICYRLVQWALAPVPFRIPTTCGQQKSLPWIKSARLDNPSTGLGAVGRMALEVLLFRSLFRNNQAELYERRFVFGDSKYLWLGALAFHWSLLIVLLRHLRLPVEPVPQFVLALNAVDGFFQIGAPVLYLSNLIVLGALVYLLLRRWRDPQLRYISQFSDYFAPLLLLGIAVSGMLMRYGAGADVVAVKRFAIGLATFQPVLPEGLGLLFWIHLLLVSALAACFPFSKLMHMGGVFLSPTRNLANNSRIKRHINPWNYPVKTHTYAEWEHEFHDKIKAAGIPLDEEQKNG
ncbi:MAG: sulfate reduction electron transfer complex DsrMKJOP subunit DsrM [Desulfuromonadales bacterium]|nr:sulfate reduction electron transfer complex DsrMKJOP subunit DsrM [Desulfuromonadales bacterium]